MSQLAGILNLGIPMGATVQSMVQQLSGYSAEQNILWQKALSEGVSVALHQPLGSYLFKYDKHLFWDGELDNRQTLQQQLGLTDLQNLSVRQQEMSLVLAAWQRWGAQSLEHLKGEYAFVIFDHLTGQLHLARDILGARPLFFSANTEQYAFCSQSLPLLQNLQLSTVFEVEKNLSFLYYGTQIDERKAINDIQSVAPGSVVTVLQNLQWQQKNIVNLRQISQQLDLSIRQLEDVEKHRILEDQLKKRLFEYQKNYPKMQVLFNDGLSAGLVAALRNPVKSEMTAVVYVPCTQQGPVEGALAQRDQARFLATYFKMPLQEIEVQLNPSADFPRLLANSAQQFCSTHTVQNDWLGLAAQQMQAPVILSTLGADVLLGKDPLYACIHRADYFRQWPEKLRWILQKILGQKFRVYGQALQWADISTEIAWQQSRYVFDETLVSLFNKSDVLALLAQTKKQFSEDFWQFRSDTVNRWIYLDILWQVGLLQAPQLQQFFYQCDKKLLLPFFDEALLPLAFSLSGPYKLRHTLSHWLSHYAPDLPKLSMVSVQLPLRQWLRQDLKSQVQDYLLSSNGLSGRGYCSAPQLEKMVKQHQNNEADHTEILWRLLCLEHVLRSC